MGIVDFKLLEDVGGDSVDFRFQGVVHTVCVTDSDEGLPCTKEDVVIMGDGGYDFHFVGACVDFEMVARAIEILL